jgi:outer membrane murein-binding lipoprotein Lpp
MLLRGAILVVFGGVLLAGCANNQPLSSGFAGQAQAAESDQDPSKKTMASKVLSAIALERVTGRKPDPARLNELN